MRRARQPVTVTVDMVQCNGHGICAWLFPERVSLDEWGFAQVDPEPVTDRSGQRRARHARRACPRGAVRVNVLPAVESRPTVSS